MSISESQELTLPVFALRLRSLVLALGELAHPPWWKTEFMSEIGFRFLERLYPRSYFRAAIHAATQAACEFHDQAVGRVGVYHLFRLPESLEAELYHVSTSTDEEFVSEFRLGLGDAAKLLNILGAMCGTALGTEVGLGARRIGSALDLEKPDSFSKIAAFYLNAFEQGKPGFPYLATE